MTKPSPAAYPLEFPEHIQRSVPITTAFEKWWLTGEAEVARYLASPNLGIKDAVELGFFAGHQAKL